MKIEVMDFYPFEQNEEKEFLTGTLKINLLDIGLNILGVFISKRKKFWHVSIPGRIGIHHETGESVRYPFVAFEDREKQKELIHAIREQGCEYIEKRLADKENPLIFPENKRKTQINQKPKQVKTEQSNDRAVVFSNEINFK